MLVKSCVTIINLNTPRDFSHLATGDADGPEKNKKKSKEKSKKHKKRPLPEVMQIAKVKLK